jgi:hypothetical protein
MVLSTYHSAYCSPWHGDLHRRCHGSSARGLACRPTVGLHSSKTRTNSKFANTMHDNIIYNAPKKRGRADGGRRGVMRGDDEGWPHWRTPLDRIRSENSAQQGVTKPTEWTTWIKRTWADTTHRINSNNWRAKSKSQPPIPRPYIVSPSTAPLVTRNRIMLLPFKTSLQRYRLVRRPPRAVRLWSD